MLPISKPFQIPTGHLFYYNRNNIQMEELKQFFKNEDSEISDSSYEKRDEIYSNIETKELQYCNQWIWSKTRELKSRTWPWMTRLNSGIWNRHNFLLRANFLFKKTGNDSVNYFDSGHIKRFWSIPWKFDFEIFANFLKSPNEYLFLRWSFWGVKRRVLIWFRLNSRNLNPRNYENLVGFLLRTFFRSQPHP